MPSNNYSDMKTIKDKAWWLLNNKLGLEQVKNINLSENTSLFKVDYDIKDSAGNSILVLGSARKKMLTSLNTIMAIISNNPIIENDDVVNKAMDLIHNAFENGNPGLANDIISCYKKYVSLDYDSRDSKKNIHKSYNDLIESLNKLKVVWKNVKKELIPIQHEALTYNNLDETTDDYKATYDDTVDELIEKEAEFLTNLGGNLDHFDNNKEIEKETKTAKSLTEIIGCFGEINRLCKQAENKQNIWELTSMFNDVKKKQNKMVGMIQRLGGVKELSDQQSVKETKIHLIKNMKEIKSRFEQERNKTNKFFVKHFYKKRAEKIGGIIEKINSGKTVNSPPRWLKKEKATLTEKPKQPEGGCK